MTAEHGEGPAERGPLVRLEVYDATWPTDDLDANFRAEVAAYTLQDPLVTLERVAANTGIAVGALARYILARWATGGAEGVMELGPSTVERMRTVVDEAETVGTDAARLDAYRKLAPMVGWLAVGLDEPETAYPHGGGAPEPRPT